MTRTEAETLPASWYFDPSIYARERASIFGQEWLAVGRSSPLQKPGHYLATVMAGWPILLVVDNSGQLRGFHNVCRHRAGPLVRDGDGHCTTLVCRYHGWAYDLGGGLVSARDFGTAEGFDVEDHGLFPIRTEVWRGLVFANLAPAGPSLHDALGSFADQCEAFPIEDLAFSHEVSHDIDANWKTYADNYLEGYHIPLVHRALNREIDAKRYQVDVGDKWCRHSAPARDGSTVSGLWIWRWPNLALNIYTDGMNMERFIPLGPTRTRIVYQYFFRGLDADSQHDRDSSTRMSAELLDEDRDICEAVQRNLEAGAYQTGRLSPRHEQGVAAFQGLVRRAVEGERSPPVSPDGVPR